MQVTATGTAYWRTMEKSAPKRKFDMRVRSVEENAEMQSSLQYVPSDARSGVCVYCVCMCVCVQAFVTIILSCSCCWGQYLN